MGNHLAQPQIANVMEASEVLGQPTTLPGKGLRDEGLEEVGGKW
jgi:hypothetical protein